MSLSILEQVFGIPYFRHSPEGDLLDELVGTILSQNTSDTNSRRAFRALKQRYATWESVLNADPDHLEETIRGGGLAAIKSRRIQIILKEIQEREGSLSLHRLGALPNQEGMDYLLSLNGVGCKTAACVLMFGLGRDLCPVDTHVHRVANRLGWVKTRQPDQTYGALQDQIPVGKAYSLHINLIRLGKTVCTARQPDCTHCPLAAYCPSAGIS
ncbi:MAG: endonuclease III [Synechococcaceae cyanobacterium RM1_1_27]|nr:endonuclease III [Synechococcaceae cyanobacterium SM2_3_2]NJO85522.1 endonuclease III [Synechococcaceae cyanobacterium RM1_1_27]